MKRLVACFALLSLLLSGCASLPEKKAGKWPSELTGTWVNAGQYTDGKDFVETMTLNDDGTVRIHMDYQGRSYATMEGTWRTKDGVLTVAFADPNVKDRTYSYTINGDTLTLEGYGKTVEYTRDPKSVN